MTNHGAVRRTPRTGVEIALAAILTLSFAGGRWPSYSAAGDGSGLPFPRRSPSVAGHTTDSPSGSSEASDDFEVRQIRRLFEALGRYGDAYALYGRCHSHLVLSRPGLVVSYVFPVGPPPRPCSSKVILTKDQADFFLKNVQDLAIEDLKTPILRRSGAPEHLESGHAILNDVDWKYVHLSAGGERQIDFRLPEALRSNEDFVLVRLRALLHAFRRLHPTIPDWDCVIEGSSAPKTSLNDSTKQNW